MQIIERQAYISYLRIFATIVVIWHHTCGTLAGNSTLFCLTHQQTLFYEAARQSVSWDVPIFFMITGALLLNPEKKLSIKKILLYVRRILLALIIFGIPCAMVMNMMEMHEKGINWEIIQASLISVINNTGLGHFWYLYDLIGLYLVLPLLKIFVENAEIMVIRFLLIALVLFDFIFPTLSAYAAWGGQNVKLHSSFH